MLLVMGMLGIGGSVTAASAESGLEGIETGKVTPRDCSLAYAAFDFKPVVVDDFAEMTRLLREHAEAGNPCAQFELGMMYLDGVGVGKDSGQAVQWLEKAADAGHADAQHTLGLLTAHGVAVERNVDQAVEWFYRAGLSYLAIDSRRLALREVDYINRERPGHPRADELRDAINKHWLSSQRLSGD